MRNNSLAKIALFLLLFLISLNSFAIQQFSITDMQLNHKLYHLEIADSDERKQQGLMNRQRLDQDAGMLFVYDRPGYYRIWMKNTLVPLTVIWLDEQAKVIGKKILYPCKVKNCPVSGVSKPSKFIIELHPSEFDRFKAGDQLPAILSYKN